jgi:hypothetical protein
VLMHQGSLANLLVVAGRDSRRPDQRQRPATKV